MLFRKKKKRLNEKKKNKKVDPFSIQNASNNLVGRLEAESSVISCLFLHL